MTIETYDLALKLAMALGLAPFLLTYTVYSDARLSRTGRTVDLLDRNALREIGSNLLRVAFVMMLVTTLPPMSLWMTVLVLCIGYFEGHMAWNAKDDYVTFRNQTRREMKDDEVGLRPLERLADASRDFPLGVAIAVAVTGLLWF